MTPPNAPAPAAAAPKNRRLLALALLLTTAAAGGAARGQDIASDDDRDGSGTTATRDWAHPSRGPSPSGRGDGRAGGGRGAGAGWEAGPWFVAASAGPAWFGGDDLSDSISLAAQVRVGCDLSDEAYLVGSYLFGLPETEDGGDGLGDGDEERHDLHAITLGVGLRAEVTPEVQLFVEPRAGVVVGSDIDAAPVGALTGGVVLSVAEGIAVRFEITGLLTDAEIEMDGAEATLDSAVVASFGLSFEL